MVSMVTRGAGMAVEWWRSWHGAPTDPKWLSIARRSGVGVDRVICIIWYLMDCASQAGERGDISGCDHEGFCDFTGIPDDEFASVIAALNDKGILVNGRFAAWEKRQPKRERDQDISTNRVRAFRQRQHLETPCNATKRLDKEEEEEEEEDTEKRKSNSILTIHSPSDGVIRNEFHKSFWPAYPNKIGKGAALTSFVKARKKATLDIILAGLTRYVNKTDDRPWCHPTTWLNQERWLDEPAEVVPMSRAQRETQQIIAEIDAHASDGWDGDGSSERELRRPRSLPANQQLSLSPARSNGLHQAANNSPDWAAEADFEDVGPPSGWDFAFDG